jgi:predicted transcriptional regulator
MQQLTNNEEQLMEHLWAGESLYKKIYSDVSQNKDPRPTTTLLKRMIDDFVATLGLISENTIH